MEKATIYEYARMCASFEKCSQCTLFKFCAAQRNMFSNDIDKANEIILKWCKEHPVKTRQSELLKAFPNVPIDFETVDICPLDFDKRFDDEMCHSYEDCTACKKEYWLAEVDKNE